MRIVVLLALLAPFASACTGSVQVKASANVSTTSGEHDAPSTSDGRDTASDSIVIRYARPVVGTRTVRKLEQTFWAHLASGKGTSLEVHRLAEQRLRILGVEGEHITKLEVAFVADETIVASGKSKKKVVHTPLVGRTFVLARGVVRPRVFVSDDVPASPKDSALVSQLIRSLDDDDFDNGGFPTGAMSVGERVPTLERSFAWDLVRATGNSGRVRTLSITLSALRDGAEGREAVFALDLAWSESFGDFQFEGQLRGTLVYRSDGRLVSMTAKGPAMVEGSLGRIEGGQEISLTETRS